MKAISLHQPFASLIARGIKTIETRSFSIRHRGELAIHAAKKWTSRERLAWQGFSVAFRGRFPALESNGRGALPPPLGAIVALAEVTACVEFAGDELVTGRITQTDAITGDCSPGRFGWRLEGVRALAEPLPLEGRQSLWSLTPAIAAEVLARASGGGTKLSPEHRQIIEHSLGLDNGRGTTKPYRDYFCASVGSLSDASCEALVARGLMRYGHNDGRARYYFVTETGAAAVGHKLPKETS